MTKWTTDRAELTSLRKPISDLTEYMRFYQSRDRSVGLNRTHPSPVKRPT